MEADDSDRSRVVLLAGGVQCEKLRPRVRCAARLGASWSLGKHQHVCVGTIMTPRRVLDVTATPPFPPDVEHPP